MKYHNNILSFTTTKELNRTDTPNLHAMSAEVAKKSKRNWTEEKEKEKNLHIQLHIPPELNGSIDTHMRRRIEE